MSVVSLVQCLGIVVDFQVLQGDHRKASYRNAGAILCYLRPFSEIINKLLILMELLIVHYDVYVLGFQVFGCQGHSILMIGSPNGSKTFSQSIFWGK